MKKKLLILLFFCTTASFSQEAEENTSLNNLDFIDQVLNNKTTDYFKIKTYVTKEISSEEAEELYSECVEENYILGQIYALNILGKHYRNQSKFNKSIETHNKALKLSEEIKSQEATIYSLNMLGICYRRQTKLKESLSAHQKSLFKANTLQPKTKDITRNIAIAENSIGNIYLTLKQYRLAVTEFENALKKNIELNDETGVAITYDNIGYAYEQMGFLDKAIDNYNKSLFYNKEINSKVGKIICNNRICSVLIKKGYIKDALNIISPIYKEALSLNDQYYIAKTLGNLGWAQLKNKEFEKAKKSLINSLNISMDYNLDSQFITTSYHLSELYKEKNDYKKALFYFKEAKELDDKITSEQNITYISDVISRYNIKVKENEISNLKSKNKETQSENSKNRNVLIITLVSLALLSVALYSIYRQRLLNNDRRILLLEQQALQAQMNPHFIFNALNSIKLYIINNEQKNAVYYLNKFSKLIRNILDVSKVKEVSLQEELKTMDLYMSIENIRFNNEITYEQKINSDLNLDTIKLPPLVLQPFLENAIWHGLSPKEDNKKVVLSAFKVSKNLIEISIADNGVGREAAMEIKKGKNVSLKRKSIGIDLTKERLKTFASDFMHDFSLKYYDLKDDNGNPKGTKVALRIPLR